MPAKTKKNPHVLFDTTSFATLMHSAESSASESGLDECAQCGEHMLDCECDETEEVILE
jgi:hypothetical protein